MRPLTRGEPLRADRRPARPDVKLEKEPTPRKRAIKLLMDLRPEAQRGPGVSRVAFRLSRIWKKVWVRRVALLVLPAALLGLIGWRLAQDPTVHAALAERRDAVVQSVASMPEFAIRNVRVTGATPALARRIEADIALPEGASSLTYDLAEARRRIADIAAVRSARVVLVANGVLLVEVVERLPAALWRGPEDGLWLADREGVVISAAGARGDHPDLPVVLGEGATAAMAEALDLFDAVPDLRHRLRAFVRVGERRWNVVLDRDMTILLPERDAKPALARVMAWHYGDRLLDRDIASIDMRLPERPTVRMTGPALDAYRLKRATESGEGEDT